MRKYFCIIIILIVAICNKQNSFAQVTIGDVNQPAVYSIVQLEKTEKIGGFRLPRLTEIECARLKSALGSKSLADRIAARGLVVYETTHQMLLYWDETDWQPLEPSVYELASVNGISTIDPKLGGLKLGGSLDRETTIALDGKELSFPANSDVDKFMVSNAGGDPTFVVADGKIGIGTGSPSAKVEVENSDGSIKDLRISNSGEAGGYLLASDYYGNALWQPLKPLSSVISGRLQNGIAYIESSTNISEAPLRLSKGKWLLVAKYTGRYNGNSSGFNDARTYYSYIIIKKRSTPELTEANTTVMPHLCRAGSLPSYTAYTGPDGNSNMCYVTPQVFYYVEVKGEDEYFSVAAASSRNFITTPVYGGGYFFALRIDEMGGGAIAVSGSSTSNLGVTIPSFNLKTGQSVNWTPSTGTDYIAIKLTSGALHLEEGNSIGSIHGINLVVVGGPYDISSSHTSPTNVKVKITGVLEPYVRTGSYPLFVNISNADLGPCQVATVNVLTEGTIDCSKVNAINLITGKNFSVNEKNTLGLNLTSGSVTLNPGAVLGSSDGISVEYDGSLGIQTYYAKNNYTIPVVIQGTVAGSAIGSFQVPVSFTGIDPAIIGSCSGATINVVDGSINCGGPLEILADTLVQYTKNIDIMMTFGSASYTLKRGQVLGSISVGNSRLKVTYVGNNDLLMIGGNNYSVPVIVAPATISGVPAGSYTIPIDELSKQVGISSCNLQVIAVPKP